MLEKVSSVSLLPGILAGIERFLVRRRTVRAKRTDNHRQAAESVLVAVLETERYLYDLGDGVGPSQRRESRLARLWSKAAIDVRLVDRRLSRIALMTSFTWANPALLDDPRYGKVPGQLGLIREQCEWLLEHWDQ